MSSLIQPDYAAGSFADLPSTFQDLLEGKTDSRLLRGPLAPLCQPYEKVVFLFVDGLGWRFIENRLGRTAFLDRCRDEGVLVRMTSQFPSTTAAHVTTIHTGLTPNQSGIYEWNLYLPQLDTVISPLLWSVAGDGHRESLAGRISPQDVLPARTWYQDASEKGITSHLFISENLAPSTYSIWMHRGAKVHATPELPGFLPDFLEFFAGTIAQTQGPAYFFYYYTDIDTANHLHGPRSRTVANEIDYWFAALETWIWQWRKRLPRTLLILSADHGHAETDPRRTVYLNRNPRFRRLLTWLQCQGDGRPIVPAGSSRDFFLHIKPEHLDEAQRLLADRLEGRAEVRLTKNLETDGFFGPGISADRFRERVGNLVVLPYLNESVWWFEEGRHEHVFRGHHGGLTPEEVEVPLMALPLD